LNPDPQLLIGTRQLKPDLRDGFETAPDAFVEGTTKATLLYPTTLSTRPLLRVGIMLDDWTVPAWVTEVLKSIQRSGVAKLTTIILSREPPAKGTNSGERLPRPLTRRSASPNSLLWRLYLRVDERLRGNFTAPFHPKDARMLFPRVKWFDLLPQCEESFCRFTAIDSAAVKRECLDVILYFGSKILRGDILSVSKYGVWSYHHGDNTEYQGRPAGFWEMYDSNLLTGTVLRVLTENNDGDRVIYRSYGATRSFESLLVNRCSTFQKAIPFVARCLRKIDEHGLAGIAPEAKAPATSHRVYGTPRNGQMLRFLTRAAFKMLAARIQECLCIDPNHWFLAIARGVAPGQPLVGKVTALYPPKGRFWADPMIVSSKGQVFVFFEDYDYTLRRAHISVVELDATGRAGTPRAALVTDHHLSYPFVFEWRGEYFMIPETASMNAVHLYRAVEFPTRWEYVQDLLTDINAVDATICVHGGRWYLFTCVSESGGSTCDELFLFVAETPLGPWIPHPMNPIVSDVRSARPAGALFYRDGVLYRPAQNSAKTYGHSLAIMEVTELTPDRYAERLAYRIEPDWLPNIYGCHTISMAGDLMALDCKTFKWRP